jgi:hypothetical protein
MTRGVEDSVALPRFIGVPLIQVSCGTPNMGSAASVSRHDYN